MSCNRGFAAVRRGFFPPALLFFDLFLIVISGPFFDILVYVESHKLKKTCCVTRKRDTIMNALFIQSSHLRILITRTVYGLSVVLFLSLWGFWAGCLFDPSGAQSLEKDARPPDARPDVVAADHPPIDGPQTDAPACVEGDRECRHRPGRVVECVNADWQTVAQCDFGCSYSPDPQCAEVRFSAGLQKNWLDDAAVNASELHISHGRTYVLDTTHATLDGTDAPAADTWVQQVIDQEGDISEILVMCFASIQIDSGSRLHIIGERPLVLCAADTIMVGGAIDASAHLTTPGPGGFSNGGSINPAGGDGRGNPGQVGSGFDFQNRSGGGGGGYCARGGQGGSAGNASGGQGGDTYGGQPFTRLFGGSAGGAGGSGTQDFPGTGGGGGGALMLAALDTIIIDQNGWINVGGGGGLAGRTENAGGGGGSGGGLLLEAPTITIDGVLAANGGGGGGSDVTLGNLDYEHGQDGLPSAEAAQGGTRGGNGSGSEHHAGYSAPATDEYGGGGGGGCGRIRINSNFPVTSGPASVISPALNPNELYARLSLQE
jgi:hypothetical protein